MAITQKDSIPTCSHSVDAGSYYEPLPWHECRLRPTPATGGCEMCNLDMNKDCKVYEKEVAKWRMTS